uniref:TIR domain-containing protein n=1 Tax=Candidatus Kentrum sp. MB TaxID=2138164 RepID=A0A450XS51_9GAMM|nr:MAG: TIR domain-containing protein [Candidatus Kentron sp. MB]
MLWRSATRFYKLEWTKNVTFDVFLSHNSQDKPLVRELVQALKSRGLMVWLDDEQLVPGRPWQKALETTILTTRSVLILVGNSGLSPWGEEEMRASLGQHIERQPSIIPVLLPNAPKEPELPPFLRNRTWVDLRGGLTSQGIDKLEWGITGEKPG